MDVELTLPREQWQHAHHLADKQINYMPWAHGQKIKNTSCYLGRLTIHRLTGAVPEGPADEPVTLRMRILDAEMLGNLTGWSPESQDKALEVFYQGMDVLEKGRRDSSA